MEKSTFVPGDLVLVNLPVPKRPSQRWDQIPREGLWPAKITQKLPNCNRRVMCYATGAVIMVPVQSLVVYNKETIKAYLAATRVDKDSVLAQALAEIEADFVAKSGTAEEIHLSGEAKLVTSVVKSAGLLETLDVDNMLMNLWNVYVEKSIGKTLGICHLQPFIEDFVKEHEEVITGDETYRDLMLHVCCLEEVGLISRFQVKSIVESLTELNDRWKSAEREEVFVKDGSSNVAMECPSDASAVSTPPLAIECPDIIDVVIDSPKEITTNALKFAFPGEVMDNFCDKSTSHFIGPNQAVLSDFHDKSVDAISDITVLNITSDLKNAALGEVLDKLWLKFRKRSQTRPSKTNWPRLNSRRNRSRTRSSDKNFPWLSSQRSRTRSRDGNLSEASQQTRESAITGRSEIPPGEVEEQQTVMPYEPRVFPLSEEEYNKMVAHETRMTPECNKRVAQETPIMPEGDKMVDQETRMTQECNKMVAQETRMTQECNKQVDQKTLKAPEYNKMMAQKTPKAPKYKMVAQETPMDEETLKGPEYNKAVAQETLKAPKCKMAVQETPKVLEYKAHKYNKIVDEETTKPLQYEMVTVKVPEYKLEAEETSMVPLQPVSVDTTSNVFSDRPTEITISVPKSGTMSLYSTFEAQTSFQGGAIPAMIDYSAHIFNSTSNEINCTSTEGIDFEDGNHSAVVPNKTSEAQMLGDATPPMVIDYPTYIIDATSTERIRSISGDGYHAVATNSPSEAQKSFLGDATPILVIDYPTYNADASTNSVTEDGNPDVVSDSSSEAQTSLLGDATPVLVIDYPDHIIDAISNVTNDTSERTNNLSEDGHSAMVSDSSSESQINPLDGAIPAVEIDYPISSSTVNDATSKAIIDNPTDTTNAVLNTNAKVRTDFPLDNATSFEVLDYLTDTTQTTSLNNHSTQATSMLNHSTRATSHSTHPTQATSLSNHPTHATSLNNHPTQTASILNSSDKTTGLVSEPAQLVLDYPVNTNLLAPTEPDRCGDLLEQWWFGPRFGEDSSKYMQRKNNKIPFGILVKGGNNNCNKARGGKVSSGITRNLDKNFNNKEIVVVPNDETETIKDDTEIEIVGALGSGTFVEKVFCNTKGKQVTIGTKRKRPPETVEVHKKYLMYHENGENLLHDNTDEACVHGRRSKESDSSIKQSLQGYCRCGNIRTEQSGKALRSTNQDTNGNKCAVKINMNIEMSRDSFNRVALEIPNFRSLVTQKP